MIQSDDISSCHSGYLSLELKAKTKGLAVFEILGIFDILAMTSTPRRLNFAKDLAIIKEESFESMSNC